MQPVGVYAIIDEESRFPKATDLTLIEKMTKTFIKQLEFQRVKNQNMQFVIHHFAGPVRVCCCNKDSKVYFSKSRVLGFYLTSFFDTIQLGNVLFGKYIDFEVAVYCIKFFILSTIKRDYLTMQ